MFKMIDCKCCFNEMVKTKFFEGGDKCEGITQSNERQGK